MDVHDDRTELLLALGRGLHQAGITTDALEETLRDVAIACGIELQVNALPTSLTLAVGPAFEQRLVILRLEPGKVHLRKLALLEGVVDAVRRGRSTPGEALADVIAIDTAVQPVPPLRSVLAYALLSQLLAPPPRHGIPFITSIVRRQPVTLGKRPVSDGRQWPVSGQR